MPWAYRPDRQLTIRHARAGVGSGVQQRAQRPGVQRVKAVFRRLLVMQQGAAEIEKDNLDDRHRTSLMNRNEVSHQPVTDSAAGAADGQPM